MKKIFLPLILAMLVLLCAALVGCSGFGGGDFSIPDYNADIEIVLPEDIDTDFCVPEEDKTYYTSPGFSLWMEVNGAFFELDYFYLEGTKRVYDNLYLYEDDYFYMLTDDLYDLYASLADTADGEFAEEEKQAGEDIQINVKKSGIYKLIFDTETLKFDMEYKGEITEPVYYTMKSCSVYSVATKWVETSVNPDNEDEFVLKDFNIGMNEFISLSDRSHVSIYKVTLTEDCNEKYGVWRYPNLTVNVGGVYDVYVNRKSYEVRLEIKNPDTADYNCVYYDGEEFISLTPYDESTPYVFRLRLVVDKSLTRVPDFHTEKYKTYALTPTPCDFLMISGKNAYFKEVGTYDVIIDLKAFKITVERLPE